MFLLKLSPVPFMEKLSKLRHTNVTKVFQSSPSFSRTDTLPSPHAFSQQPTLPHTGKLPAVTVLTFETECKMTSRQCVVACSVSIKKQLLTTPCLVTSFMDVPFCGSWFWLIFCEIQLKLMWSHNPKYQPTWHNLRTWNTVGLEPGVVTWLGMMTL